MGSDPAFPRLVSLACHDLRTPLATVQGFASTLLRQGGADERSARWLEMIEAASRQMAELLDDVSLAARIEDGRYDPVVREADSLELARAGFAGAEGSGAPVRVDAEAVPRAIGALAEAAARHGGVEVTVVVDGPRVRIAPVTEAAAPVVLGEELKDLRAAVAVRLFSALGGSVALDGDGLWVSLPE